jgi:hypothetical protein
MNRSRKLILQIIVMIAAVAFWFFIAFMLSQLVAYTKLVEMFLVTLGGLLLACLGVFLTREMSNLSDLRHSQRTQRRLRELKLWERKQEQSLLTSRCRRLSRGR